MSPPPRASDFGLPEPTPEDEAFWTPHLRDGETLLWAGRTDLSPWPLSVETFHLWSIPILIWYFVAVLMLNLPYYGCLYYIRLKELIFSVILGVITTIWFFHLRPKYFSNHLDPNPYALTDKRALVARKMSFSDGMEFYERALDPAIFVSAYRAGSVVLSKSGGDDQTSGALGGDMIMFRLKGGHSVAKLMKAVRQANA